MTDMQELMRLRKREKVFRDYIQALRDIVYDDGLSKSWKVTQARGVLNDLQDALRRLEK